MSEGKIIEIYNQGISQVIDAIQKLTVEIKTQKAEIETLSKENKLLTKRVISLESQINKNSNNSSKPPSADGFKKKTKSLRTKSGKKPGGQEGHEGHTLFLSENPDEIIVLQVPECNNCGEKFSSNTQSKNYIRRQVIDIPNIKAKTTEFRAEVVICPKCKTKNVASFPSDVMSTVQYGNKLKAAAVYLTQYQLIPYKRSAELIADLFNIKLSQGSIVTFNEKCHERLEPVENNIKDCIANSIKAVHFDETGVYIDKKLKWLHVASNEEYTYYKAHEKRGKIATDAIGILPRFHGTAVHDCFKTYHQYTDCDHALCNAHILRELNGITELYKQDWAKLMKELLIEIKKEVDLHYNTANALPLDKIEAFEKTYDEILKSALDEDYSKNIEVYSQPKVKKSVSLNLINRLAGYNEQILAFMHDFDIPFDNNLAERDIRMTKVKQKISGGFRSTEGADGFTRIRGYISTVRKNCLNALECIESVFSENPVDPTLA